MSTTKKISFVVVILVVIGVIWYLEGMKVHPAEQSGSASQAINISNTPTVGSSTSSSTPTQIASLQALAAADQQAGYQPAIEIADPTGFINVSSTFTLSSLIGKKVILLDFWTYSCINCIRTIPYLNAWYQKYQADGLVIVGIHTPEFDFEKELSNVQAAVISDDIQYPVVLDSNYGTWNAYNNLYWPHEYLIDLAGYIVHDHVGEGDYDTTEAEIQKLLAQRAQILGTSAMVVPTSTVNIQPANLDDINSPETYFGAERNSTLANGTPLVNGTQTLALPTSIQPNTLYLGGTWNFDDQYATNMTSGAKAEFEYDSAKVYFVASGAATGTTVEVLQDGQPLTATDAGSDVQNSKVVITGSKLYNLINNQDGGGEHTLELIVDSPGLQAFTFTFG